MTPVQHHTDPTQRSHTEAVPPEQQVPNHRAYYSPHGGLPPQTHLTTERAIVTEAYTVIPKAS